MIGTFHERISKAVGDLERTWDFDMILVNDSNRDRPLEIMCNLVKSDPQLRVIELRRNYGQASALQAGLDVARGEVFITAN